MINKERWEQVENIYHAVLERDPAVRTAFLEEACAGDDDLRNEVDSLLKFDGAADKFIETPALQLEAKAIAAEDDFVQEEFPLTEIGPYRIVSIINHGGMGEVFLAVDSRLDRKVAIKLLAKEFTADPDRIARFKQEAKTTSALSHPNIVTLFEIGEVSDRQYIVTEFVEGKTLREQIAESHLQPKEAIAIVIQVLSALDAAHQAGVIHRDIKPENIVVRKDGLVKVLDFGIAKLTAAGSDSRGDLLTTQTGVVMGTASYMSPEQARGQKVDHRADIFSVGAMLYEMLSGKRPFEGETPADVMAAVLIKDPAPLATVATNVPPSLQRIVERCIEKQPDKRFQTASDLAFSLKEFSASRTLATSGGDPLVTVQTKPVVPLKRRGLAPALIIIAVVVIGALIAANAWRSRGTLVAQPEIKKPIAITKLTQLVWFDTSGRQIGTIGPPGEYSGLALSPSEDRIVVALYDTKAKSRDIWIFPVGSENGTRLTTDPSDDLNPVWTPDSQWIIFTAEKNGVRSIFRKRADGSGEVEPLYVTSQTANVEDISRDGRLLMFNTGSQENKEPNLSVFALADRKVSPFRTATTREDGGRFSPDANWVAYRSFETNESEIFIRRINRAGAASTQKWIASSGGANTQPMWRGDGRVLYYLDHKTLTAVELEVDGNTLTVSPPSPLFNVNIEDSERRNRFVVTKDGERFLVIVRQEAKPV